MLSQRQLKSRIRSVKNTKQITKAMQMVAASKMRRAQGATKLTAPYTKTAREILAHLAKLGATNGHPLFEVREVKSRLLIVIASDKGLAGAYNANIAKHYFQELVSDDKIKIKTHSIAVGRKVTQFVTRLKDAELVGAYEDLPDNLEGYELRAALDTAYNLFMVGTVDAVDVVYTEFISSVTQTPKTERLLPAGQAAENNDAIPAEAEFEPDTETVLKNVVYRLVGAQLFQALLDARASEHSMRMIAMKNATDNASDLVDDLTLAMNKARQAAITQELAEISGGSEAMG
ncbi:ATP synthase gamma chain [Candidatus Saccharibacteria bacterium RAAC3_TM7_1]|nr:ATP synthase gamma chain [Candidatus Saccharibacteria bacterium RAAC3_TM7_1]HCZ28601.1 ATP synthase F1 subunit gamma [Candidatus Saccharibacteria bacterium]